MAYSQICRLLRSYYVGNPDPACFVFLKYMCSLVFFEQVRGGQLWGTDIYTDDSDLVAGMYLSNLCKLLDL